MKPKRAESAGVPPDPVKCAPGGCPVIWVERWWLERQLGGGDPARAAAAAEQLGAGTDPAVIPALAQAARNGEQAVSSAAAQAIAKIGGPPAEAALVELLGDHRSREAAARALAGVPILTAPAAALRALCATLDASGSPGVLIAATEALVVVGDAAAIPSLQALLDHTSAEVRDAALTALDTLGWDPGIEGRARREVARRFARGVVSAGAPATGPLVAVLSHPDALERLWALERLAELPIIAPVPALAPTLEALTAESDPARLLLLVHVLVRARDPRCATTILALTNSAFPEVRRAAVGALGAYPEQRTTDRLCQLLADPQVGDEAVEALKHHTPAPAALLAAFDPQDRVLARRLLAVLGAVHEPEVTAHLAQLLADEDPEIRAAAARALAGHPDPSVVGALVEHLFTDADPDARAAAALGLRAARAGTEAQAFDALAVALREDPAPDVRATCAQVLAERGDRDRLGALLGALGDADAGVRRAAAQALSEADAQMDVDLAMRRAVALRSDADIGRVIERVRGEVASRARAMSPPEIEVQASKIARDYATPCLVQVLRHPDSRERCWACDRLARLGNAESPAALTPLVDDGNSEVRIAAMRALATLLGAGAISTLVARLLDPVTEVQRLAVDLLARVGWEADAAGAAVRGVATRDEAAVMLAGARTARLLTTQVAHTDPEQRAWVARILGRTGSTEAVPSLVAMLDDEEWVTQHVLRSLQALRWAPGPEDRLRYAFAARDLLDIARIGADAVPLLAERISWPDARAWVVRALGVTQATTAVPVLEAVLASDQWEPECWSMAVDALAALKWQPSEPVHRVRVAMVRNAWEWSRGIGEEGAAAVLPLLGRKGRDAATWTAQLLDQCPNVWPSTALATLAARPDERDLRTIYASNSPTGHDWVLAVDWAPVRTRAAAILEGARARS